MAYCWSQGYSYQQTMQESRFEARHPSKETVADWYSYCLYSREVCILTLDTLYEEQGRIGGHGCVLEIDEIKIDKRKHNVGRMVEVNLESRND